MSLGVGAGIVLQVALLATGGETYAEAHRLTTRKGCPLVVMIGATWCPACQDLKQNVMPEVKRHGILRKVAFAEVDLDEERELGTELTNGGPIPQIVVYRKTPGGWRLRRLIGGRDVRTVERFIVRGFGDDDDEADPPPATGADEEEEPTPEPAASKPPAAKPAAAKKPGGKGQDSAKGPKSAS